MGGLIPLSCCPLCSELSGCRAGNAPILKSSPDPIFANSKSELYWTADFSSNTYPIRWAEDAHISRGRCSAIAVYASYMMREKVEWLIKAGPMEGANEAMLKL